MAEGNIGSVGISVIPDATAFWTRFVEQTRPGAVRAGAQLGTEVRRGMQGELDRGVDVRVRADTARARADIASLGSTAAGSGLDMGVLVKAAAALGPALIPVAAVAIPAIATLALGAKKAGQEIKHGLTDEFHRLQQVAGRSLTPGVEDLVQSLQESEPELRQIVNLFGSAFSDELHKISDALSNGGLQSFLAYAAKELPIVEDTFNHVVGAVIAVGKALTPVGNQLLADIDNLSQMVVEAQKLADTFDGIRIPKLPKISVGGVDLGGGGGGTINEFYQKWISPAGLISTGLHHLQGGLHELFTTDPISGQGTLIGGAEDAAKVFVTEKQALHDLTEALKRYDQEVDKAISKRLALAQSNDAFITAARGVADAVRENGGSLDISTAKGLANRDAILSAAQAAVSYYDAQRKAGVGAQQAAQALLGDVDALKATAVHGGVATGAVNDLLRSLHLLPHQIETLLTVDASQAYAVLDYLEAQYAHLGEPNGGATTVGSISFNRPPATPVIPGTNPRTPVTPSPVTPSATDPTAGFASALSSFLQSVTGGAKNPITAAFQQLISSIQSSGGKLSETFVNELRTENTHLRAVAKDRDQVARELERVQARLDKLRQERASEISTVRGAVTGTFDLTTAGQNDFGEPVVLFDIQSSLKQALRNATQFEHVLKKLAREGLNKQLVAQLAEAGPGALPQAQALLTATPKQLAQINSEFRQLGDTGKDLGKFVGNDLYQAGIDAADGLVKGLRSKEHELAQTMRHLAKVMIAELRRELDSHSPSRKLFNEARLAWTGYELGVLSKGNDIATAAGLVAGKSIPNRSAYKFDSMQRSAGGTLVAGDFHNHQHIPMAVPEPLSRSANAAMRAARNALGARG